MRCSSWLFVPREALYAQSAARLFVTRTRVVSDRWRATRLKRARTNAFTLEGCESVCKRQAEMTGWSTCYLFQSQPYGLLCCAELTADGGIGYRETDCGSRPGLLSNQPSVFKFNLLQRSRSKAPISTPPFLHLRTPAHSRKWPIDKPAIENVKEEKGHDAEGPIKRHCDPNAQL